MVEFTDREIKIIHSMLTLINPEFKNLPQNVRNAMMMATLKVRGLKFDEQELTDIVLGINQETTMIGANAFGLLDKFKDKIKEIGNVDIFKM